MVDTARMGARFVISGLDPDGGRLISIVLYHQSLTAKPLLEIWRALVTDHMELAVASDHSETSSDRTAGAEIVAQIAGSYGSLCDKRNNLLHGTWRIGWAGQFDEDFSEMRVDRKVVGKSGLRAVKTPKSAKALMAVVREVETVTYLMTRINFMLLERLRFIPNFRLRADRWWAPDDPEMPGDPNASSPDKR